VKEVSIEEVEKEARASALLEQRQVGIHTPQGAPKGCDCAGSVKRPLLPEKECPPCDCGKNGSEPEKGSEKYCIQKPESRHGAFVFLVFAVVLLCVCCCIYVISSDENNSQQGGLAGRQQLRVHELVPRQH